MKKWFQDMSYRMQVFMQGRYGRDELTSAISICALVLLILSIIFRPLRFLLYIAIIILVWSLYRSYSKNHASRVKELNQYYKIKNAVQSKWKLLRNMWRDRSTHRYVKCPHCKTYVRLAKPPKGKTIRINCPKCKNSFEKRT